MSVCSWAASRLVGRKEVEMGQLRVHRGQSRNTKWTPPLFPVSSCLREECAMYLPVQRNRQVHCSFQSNVPFVASEHVCSEMKLDSYEAIHSWVNNLDSAGSEERGREAVGRVGGSRRRWFPGQCWIADIACSFPSDVSSPNSTGLTQMSTDCGKSQR